VKNDLQKLNVIYPFRDDYIQKIKVMEVRKMTESIEIILEDYTDKTKPMPKHWWRLREEKEGEK
jgi:hypothetical protein